MARRRRYTPEQVIAALNETRGMVFLAARRLGCDPNTVLRYCRRYPTVQAARSAHQGEMVDLAELKLWQAIQQGEAWGVLFALRTIGKERGYVEKAQVEHTGKDGGPVELALVDRTRLANERLTRIRRGDLPTPANGTTAAG